MAPKESFPLDTPALLNDDDDAASFMSHESLTGLLKTWTDEDSMLDNGGKYPGAAAAAAGRESPKAVTCASILTEADFYDELPPLNQAESSEVSQQQSQHDKPPNCRFLNFRGSRLQEDADIFKDACIDLEKEVSYESMPSLYYDDYGSFPSSPSSRAATVRAKSSSSQHSAGATTTTKQRKEVSPAVLKKRLRQAVNREFPLPPIRIDSDVMKHLARKLDSLKQDLTETRWKMQQHKKRRLGPNTSTSSATGTTSAKKTKKIVEIDGMKLLV